MSKLHNYAVFMQKICSYVYIDKVHEHPNSFEHFCQMCIIMQIQFLKTDKQVSLIKKKLVLIRRNKITRQTSKTTQQNKQRILKPFKAFYYTQMYSLSKTNKYCEISKGMTPYGLLRRWGKNGASFPQIFFYPKFPNSVSYLQHY